MSYARELLLRFMALSHDCFKYGITAVGGIQTGTVAILRLDYGCEPLPWAIVVS
jgi:hypothetical protein